jgi:hypothetical protein
MYMIIIVVYGPDTVTVVRAHDSANVQRMAFAWQANYVLRQLVIIHIRHGYKLPEQIGGVLGNRL